MSDKTMLCSNCGNYHCCNFRPVSSASANLLKQTISTKSTVISPFQSRQIFNDYQLDNKVSPLQQTRVSTRLPSPKRVELQRPKSNSTQRFSNGKHYLFKKQPQKLISPIIKQQPILKRRASPARVNISRSSISRSNMSGSPQRIVTRSPPMVSRVSSRVGSSPSVINQMRSISPRHLVNQQSTFKNIPSSTKPATAYPIVKPAINNITLSPNIKNNSQIFNTNNQNTYQSIYRQSIDKDSNIGNFQNTLNGQASITTPLRPPPIQRVYSPNSPSHKTATTIFPQPANVMVPQVISKLQNSKIFVDGQSKVSFHGQGHHQCSYKDNRCFGFDFLGDQKHELKLDNTGHVKDFLKL